MRTLWSVLLIGLVATVGCKRESEKGGPGADSSRASKTDNRGAEESSAENTFRVEVPRTATKVQQGERKEVTVTLNRGDKFNQEVKITFKAPAGVKIEPSSATIKAGEKEHKFTVEAMPDAKVGDATIQVTGTPATGKAANVDMTVTVQKKS